MTTSNEDKESMPDFHSVSGQAETAEPAGSGSGVSTNGSKKGTNNSGASSGSSVSTLRKSSTSTLAPTASSPAAGQSPRTSRNTSPLRKDKAPALSGNLSTQPSAAAIQRALSASSVPQLQQPGTAVSDAVSKIPRGPKSAVASAETTPQWPLSPRMKSPPPSGLNSRRGSGVAQKKPDAPQPQAPSIQVLAASPATNTPPQTPRQTSGESQKSEPQLQAPLSKSSSRGPSGKSMLETVQENTSDTQEPSPAAVQAAADLKPLTKISEDDSKALKLKRKLSKTELEKQPGESGSESPGNKSDNVTRGRRESGTAGNNSQSQRQKSVSTTSKASYTVPGGKARSGDGTQNMTVETETVQSIPQSAVAPADRSGGLRGDNGGSVRLKPSNETIRPKKERKKTERKTRSVTQGTGMYQFLHAPISPVSSMWGAIIIIVSRAAIRAVERHRKGLLLVTDPDFLQSLHTIMHRRAVSSCAIPTEQDPNFLTTTPVRRPKLKRAFSSGFLSPLTDRFVRKATSKADLFEARVANAVDASANGSDSDETFVYESNPPEPRRSRHHSRTPSVTSSHSMAGEQRSAIRNYGDAFEDRRVGGKRSMKFSSNPYNDHDSPESNNGTVRSHTPRHIGRFGRAAHQSANYDPDSPFTQAAKLRNNHLTHGRSRPNSPRSPQSMQFRPGGFFSGSKKQEHPYDFDAEQNADDERQPLLSGTIRTARHGRHLHRISGGRRDSISDEFEYQDRRRYCGCFRGKLGACMLTTLMLILVVVSAVFFVFASNRPLQDVKVYKIQNVLASEQELMLDLLVGAVNPNTLGISISDMDVNVFAKSKHVGAHKPDNSTEEVVARRSRRWRRSDISEWNPNPSQDKNGHWRSPGDTERGYDSDLENSDDAQTMLLGRIFHFDQALTFEASPLTGKSHVSSGQLRLAKPGNKTESGGSARWEEMIQYPFELIVRGVLKYQLPISSRAQSAAVGAKVMVHPEDGIDSHGSMHVEPINHTDHWQWIDWPDEEEGDES